METIAVICEFFNIDVGVLERVSQDLYADMVKAVEEDEYGVLHQLGYRIDMEGAR